jgi:hypothetical protein
MVHGTMGRIDLALPPVSEKPVKPLRRRRPRDTLGVNGDADEHALGQPVARGKTLE